MQSLQNKILVSAHQVSFFIAQLLILITYGVGYSGSLAYIGSVSSILAIIISLRWDIQIMVTNTKGSFDESLDAILCVSVMALIVTSFFVLINFPLRWQILISAIAIAMHEVYVSTLFIQRSLFLYAFFRTIPAIALISLALLGYKPEVIWPMSFVISTICLSFYFIAPLKKSFGEMDLYRLKRISIVPKLYSTITATLFTLMSSSFVIIISVKFGDEYAGIWANSIRIFNSIIGFILGTLLPFTLYSFSTTNLNSEKILIFLKLWKWLLPVVIITLCLILFNGISIFNLFTPISADLKNTHLGYIFLTGIMISFIGSAQGLYQAMTKSNVLFLILILIIILAINIFYNFSFNFNYTLEVFLLLSIFLFFVVFSHMVLCLKFK